MKKKAVFISDLDGTLLKSDGTVSRRNLQLFHSLEKRVIRVIATGRSISSFRGVIDKNFPIDYLIFSCGAGVLDFKTDEILVKNIIPYYKIENLVKFLMEMKIGFALQKEIPKNHKLYYFRGDNHSEDFDRRLSIYRSVSTEIFDEIPRENFTQAIVIIDSFSEMKQLSSLIGERFPEFSIVWSTSPLNHNSTWIEIFPKSVSKSGGVKRLLELKEIDKIPIIGVGNDYNDLDFLKFADKGYMVENGPEDLKGEFEVVPSFENDGVYFAAKRSNLI
ncbi:MAG: hypothetical protein CR982_01325 [Candidatus Cloacimonadota bacterium]|nr:MAG: hypothetical protein CR982_01325 [Candidatus Cloacimonadota bacterium]PIE77949.1 MAG: hypothetical protein CSA15_10405 [Candidatus Delongbacteria bacterium]